MCDLFDWALTLADGKQAWHNSQPQAWDADVARFFAGAGGVRPAAGERGSAESRPGATISGPVADALTHVGQIAMLRRMAGCAISGENYFVATD